MFSTAAFDGIDLFIFIVFTIGSILVGLYMSRGKGDSEDYFLAGRGLTWWLVGFSLIAANISTEQFVGMSGSAAGSAGLAIASYEWMAAVTLVFVAFFFLPKFLRAGIYTIPQFLEYRYDRSARSLVSLLMVVVIVCVSVTAVTYSGATVARDVFYTEYNNLWGIPLNLQTFCWAIGATAAIYVCIGGLKACAWTDLIHGAALIVGGAIIACLAFVALGKAPVEELAYTAELPETVKASLASAGGVERFFAINSDKLTMFLPADHPDVPWVALLFGLWIPNFYYWGFNQFIIQKTFGSKSLAEGQKGVIFAAWMKLIVPFIIVVPGIIAFNLYSKDMSHEAKNTVEILRKNAANYSYIYFDKAEQSEKQGKVVSLDEGVNFFNNNFKDEENKLTFTKGDIEGFKKTYDSAKADGSLGAIKFKVDKAWREYYPDLSGYADAWNAKNPEQKAIVKEFYGYKFDSAFGSMIRRLMPTGGLKGFVLAALLGAVISALASMLNAASTIFSIDVVKKVLSINVSDKGQVIVGRICVVVFAGIGCMIAPILDNPEYGGVFKFIQEMQGFFSPGILAIFLFGMFSSKTPRFAGTIGVLVNIIVYALLYWLDKEQILVLAFLNRMAISFTVVVVILALLTIFAPLKHAVTLPVNEKISLTPSTSTKYSGIAVVVVTGLLYFIFSGLWF